MKKLLSALLCLIILTSCSHRPIPADDTQPPEKSSEYLQEDNIPQKDSVQNNDSTKKTSEADDTIKDKSSAVPEDAPLPLPEDEDLQPPREETVSKPASQTVSIVVKGLNEEILFSTSAEYREGITVFDLLLESAKEKNIPVVFSGSKSSPYIASICGLSEKQHGPSSGWVYTVMVKAL